MRAPKVDTATRRTQIAQAAFDVICADGMQALSIASIAKRLGVVPSTVYKHYSGKAEVMAAVLELLQENIQRNVDEVCQATPDALERLHLLVKTHMKMIVNNRAFLQIVFSQCSQRDDIDITSKVKETMEFFMGQVCKIIEEGKQQGAIRNDVSSTAAARMFAGMIIPAAMLFRLSPEKFDPVLHCESVWPLYLQSIRASWE